MRVANWGNSLAVRLPKDLVDSLSLKAGDELVVVDATKERLALAKDDRRERALAAFAQFDWPLPPGYKFDRDEANER
jgi:antitoxin MazE